VAAEAAILLPSTLVMVAASLSSNRLRDSPWRVAFERGMGPITLGILFAVGLKILRISDHDTPAYAVSAVVCFLMLRTRLDPYNAAAVAASYGSISAVTFITAETFLETQKLHFDGFMVAALALMESPAIVVGLLLVKLAAPKPAQQRPGPQGMRWGAVLHEAMLNSSVFLLVGSLVIGFLVASSSPHSVEKMLPFTDKLFYGVLSFFLLDMGIVAAQRLNDLRRAGTYLIAFSVLMPLFNAVVGALIARGLGLDPGNALLFVVLCASASYIAVPAAMRMTVPEANPSFYISTALGLTFPFNIIVGIPLYMALVNKLIPAAA